VRHCYIALMAIGLSACATVQRSTPQLAYDDKNQSQADTAVLSAIGLRTQDQGQIIAVDGRKTSCWEFGCPACVRVLPGTHTFTVRYSIFDDGILSYKQGEASITIEGMQSQHIYVTNYSRNGDKFSINTTDVGNRPNFRTELGLSGVNVTCIAPVSFK
jgi:hypothetical protein